MDATMTFNWLETRPATAVQARFTQEAYSARLARENARLLEENERLKTLCADLASSAELWIRLYEAALARVPEPPTAASA